MRTVEYTMFWFLIVFYMLYIIVTECLYTDYMSFDKKDELTNKTKENINWLSCFLLKKRQLLLICLVQINNKKINNCISNFL